MHISDDDYERHNDITISGWRAFIQPLRSCNCALEKVYLCDSYIKDEGVDALTNAPVNNSRLRLLDLGDNPNVTATGWLALSTLLRNPDSALELLDLGLHVSINDNVMISFADALANNSRLMNLGLSNFDSNIISFDGWEAISHILCNKLSILSTYYSNHTLQKFCSKHCEYYLTDGLPDKGIIPGWPYCWPEDLRSLLRMCVLTCPPAREAVSNTKAYHKPTGRAPPCLGT